MAFLNFDFLWIKFICLLDYTSFVCCPLYLGKSIDYHILLEIYLDFNNHTHLLIRLWKGYQRTAMWTNIWHLGILLIGELY